MATSARTSAKRNVKPLWSKFGTLVGVGLAVYMWTKPTVRLFVLRHAETRQYGCAKP